MYYFLVFKDRYWKLYEFKNKLNCFMLQLYYVIISYNYFCNLNYCVYIVFVNRFCDGSFQDRYYIDMVFFYCVWMYGKLDCVCKEIFFL